MSTPDDDAVAAGHSVDPASWRELFDELMSLVAGRFARVEPRRTAREFVLGLLSPLERKNSPFGSPEIISRSQHASDVRPERDSNARPTA